MLEVNGVELCGCIQCLSTKQDDFGQKYKHSVSPEGLEREAELWSV